MMTREEASRHLHNDWYIKNGHLCVYENARDLFLEAVGMGIKALRPVSREQVEQIKGVWIFNDDWWEFRCSKCHKGIGNIEKYKFCPHCGAPMTDEAVDILLKRLEALKDGSTTD